MQKIAAKNSMLLPAILLFIYILITAFSLGNYFVIDGTIAIAAILGVFLFRIEMGKTTWRLLLPTLVVCAVAEFVPVRTSLFLALLFSAFLLIETCYGRINIETILLLLCASPIFKYFENFVGFPIRIWLSDAATNLLRKGDILVESDGSLIKLGHFEFSVDEGCAGLHMFSISLVLTLFLIGFFKRKTGKTCGLAAISFLLFLTGALNVLSNLFRIVLLILFRVPQESWVHDLTGVFCLTVYVFMPLIFACRKMVRKENLKITQFSTPVPKIALTTFHLTIAAFISHIALNLGDLQNVIGNRPETELAGFKKTRLPAGISKFESKNCLIYIKPCTFFAAEHNPSVCWKGSGYVIKSIKKEFLGKRLIYTATLLKRNERIFAAWWFEDDALQTVDQLEWRFASFRYSRNFSLININTTSREELERRIQTTTVFYHPSLTFSITGNPHQSQHK